MATAKTKIAGQELDVPASPEQDDDDNLTVVEVSASTVTIFGVEREIASLSTEDLLSGIVLPGVSKADGETLLTVHQNSVKANLATAKTAFANAVSKLPEFAALEQAKADRVAADELVKMARTLRKDKNFGSTIRKVREVKASK